MRCTTSGAADLSADMIKLEPPLYIEIDEKAPTYARSFNLYETELGKSRLSIKDRLLIISRIYSIMNAEHNYTLFNAMFITKLEDKYEHT